MIEAVRRQNIPTQLLPIILAIVVLSAAIYLGSRASFLWLAMLVAAAGAVVLLRQPINGLFALVGIALLAPIPISTGTEVFLYPSALVIPVLLAIWLLHMIRQSRLTLVPARANLPLFLFLVASLLSLGIGYILWDPTVPRPNHFVLVQLAQWAIFALSAGTFWLAGNWLPDLLWLRRMTFFFLVVAGSLAILREFVGADALGMATRTGAIIRAPFWVLLFAAAGGQLFFNEKIGKKWQLFLAVSLLAVIVYAFGQHDERASNWVGVTAALGALCWFRFPRLRWPLAGIITALLLSGILLPVLYEFAGGDDRWFRTGGSRIALIERTLEVTAANPITGLGPAAYRYYAATEPLIYEHIVWFDPRVASHNNYVDIYSHAGLLGLALFLWFMGEVAYLGWRLRSRYKSGFAAGYVNGMLATWVGMMTIMMLADWFLPFVYNIQFLGFQASILAWLFFGGLLVLDKLPESPPPYQDPPST